MRSRQPGLWVPNSRKSEAVRRLEVVKTAEGRKGRCLFVIDDKGSVCRNLVYSNCHVIPESSILDELKDKISGKVLELRWGINKWEHLLVSSSETSPIDLNDPDTFEPQSVGTGNACVGWFACKDHDNEFWPVDVKEPDFNDPIIQFLYMCRAVLYEVDMNRLGTQFAEDWNKRAQTHPNREVRFGWNKFKRILRNRTQRAKATASRLGKIWYDWKTNREFDPDTVSGQMLWFHSKLKFAAIGLYGKGLVVTVVPVGEHRHKIGMFHLSEDADSVNEDKERLTRLSGVAEDSCDHGVEVLEELMTNGWGTIAASPVSYRRLGNGEMQSIQILLASNVAVDTIVNSLATRWPPRRGRGGRL